MAFGGAIKLTGESEYKRALKQITQSLKEVSSEMKVVTAQYGKNDTSVKALTAKQEVLTKKLTEQNSKLEMLKSHYTELSSQYSDNTKKHDALVKSYEAEKAELEKIGKELGTSSKEYQDQKAKVDALEQEVLQSAKAQEANEKAMSQMRIEMNKAEADVIKTTNELGKLETQLNEAKDAETKSKSATEDLTDTIAKQQKEVDDLKEAYQNAVLQYGKNSDEAKDYGRALEDLSGDLAKNKKALSDAKQSADNLDRSMKDVDDSTKSAGDGFTVMKGVLANLATAGIALVVDGMRKLAQITAEAWKEFDEGADIIIAKTGATGEEAKKLEKTYGEVSRSVTGDFTEIGSAVGEVNTRFNVQGKQLEDLSTRFLKFAKLNNTDVSTAIDNTQSAMAAWGLETKQTGAMLDLLNAAGQKTGVSVDQLSESLMTNAPALKEMGFNVSDAAFFLANLDKNGIDTAATMAGLKKALVNAAKEGKPMSQALNEMEESIKSAKDSTEATRIATELFGAKSGPAIALAVREGRLSFDELGLSLNDFKGNVSDTFDETLDGADKFALAMQKIRVRLAEVVSAVMDKYEPQIDAALSAIGKALEGIIRTVGKVFGFIVDHGAAVRAVVTGIAAAFAAFQAIKFANWIQNSILAFKGLEAVTKADTIALIANRAAQIASTVATRAAAAAQWLWNAALTANPIGIVIAGVAALVAAFVILWKKSEKFRNFWKGFWKVFKTIALTVIKAVVKAFTTAWDAINKAWSVAVSFFTMVWNGIKSVFSGVGNFFRTSFQTAYTGVKTVWSGAKTFFSTVWNGIKTVFAGVSAFYTGQFRLAWNGVKAIWSVAKTFFSTVWNGIKKIFDPVKTFFHNKFSGAWTSIKSVFSGWGQFFGNLWNTIKNKFSSLGTSIASAIGGAVKAGINGVITTIENAINSAISLINGAIRLINKIPKVNIPTIGKVHFNRLETGGVLEKGQIGFLEGSGAEAVVPLEKNTKWISRVAEMMKTAYYGGKNSAAAQREQFDYDSAVDAFKTALNKMDIVLDDEVAGHFVERTVTNLIYT